MRAMAKGRCLKRNHTPRYPASITIAPKYATGLDGARSVATTMILFVACRRSERMETRRPGGRMKAKVSRLNPLRFSFAGFLQSPVGDNRGVGRTRRHHAKMCVMTHWGVARTTFLPAP